MEKFINKAILIIFCLTLIPSLQGFAINVKPFQKIVQSVPKIASKEENSAAKLQKKLEKLQKELEENSSKKLPQAARETGSNGYGYAGARVGQVATRPVQCHHCHGVGYTNGVLCGFCNGKGRVMQVMNAVPRSTEKPSEPFWKSTWFIVACCVAVGFGGGYCWRKAA